MTIEPPVDWQNDIHQRIVSGNPTAFSELCEQILDYLVDHLLKQEAGRNNEALCVEVATDTLLKYEQNPDKYNPSKGLSLVGYLRMDARGDLKNALDKEIRRSKKLVAFEDPDVAERIGSRNYVQEATELDEWAEELTGQTAIDLIKELEDELDDIEKRIVAAWIIDGKRDTESIAEILGITGQSIDYQRDEVKKAKDRLKKKLTRFGERKRKG